jgi:hypothetical protein
MRFEQLRDLFRQAHFFLLLPPKIKAAKSVRPASPRRAV